MQGETIVEEWRLLNLRERTRGIIVLEMRNWVDPWANGYPPSTKVTYKILNSKGGGKNLSYGEHQFARDDLERQKKDCKHV